MFGIISLTGESLKWTESNMGFAILYGFLVLAYLSSSELSPVSNYGEVTLATFHCSFTVLFGRKLSPLPWSLVPLLIGNSPTCPNSDPKTLSSPL